MLCGERDSLRQEYQAAEGSYRYGWITPLSIGDSRAIGRTPCFSLSARVSQKLPFATCDSHALDSPNAGERKDYGSPGTGPKSGGGFRCRVAASKTEAMRN